MFLLGLTIGTILGVLTMCLVQIEREDGQVYVNDLPECQIHPSYQCFGTAECKGNPLLCESAVHSQ